MKPTAPTTVNSRGHVSRLYRVRFRLRDGAAHTWDHYGNSGLEHAFTRAKKMIAREYGQDWTGSAAICGEQGTSGEYCF